MFGFRLAAVGAACLAVTFASTTVEAAKPIKLTPSDKFGMIVVELDPAPGLNPRWPYALELSSYFPEDGTFGTDIVGHSVVMPNSQPGQSSRVYVAEKSYKTDYVISSVLYRGWGTCFNGGSYSFRAPLGSVTFLGRINVDGDVLAMHVAAEKITPAEYTDRTTNFVFDTPRPGLTPPNQIPAWESDVRKFLEMNHPDVRAQIIAADLTPVHFPTPMNGWIHRRSCGQRHVGTPR